MGYFTTYDVEITDKEMNYVDDDRKIHQEIQTEFDVIFGEESKWYDYEENMKEFSKKYPDLIFTIHGNGEGNNDIWREYFLNGESQHTEAQLVFEPCKLVK